MTRPATRAARARASSRPPRPKQRPARAPRAIVVHSLDQARAALEAAAALDVAVTLWSPPGAAAYAGAGWFQAMIAAAAAAVPAARAEAVLDCADLAGLALGALRLGLRAVCFTGAARAATRLADIADRRNARIVRRRPTGALDLRHVEDPAERCRAWLGDGA